MDAVGRNVLKYYPLPNQPGDPYTQANNYSKSGSYAVNTNNTDIRIDHHLSDRQKIFGRYSIRSLEDVPAILFPQEITIAEGRIVQTNRNQQVVAEHIYTLSSNTLLTSRLGYRPHPLPLPEPGGRLSTLQPWVCPKPLTPIPTRSCSRGLRPPATRRSGHRDHRNSTSNTYSASSSLAQTRGSHSLKFGFEGRMFRANTRELRSPSGEFRFNAAFTQGPNPLTASSTAGNGMASLLLGTGISGDRLMTQYKDEAAQSFYLAGYAQDDWRFTSKLTLNLGVRWDMDTPRTERYNRLNYFDTEVRSPLAGVIAGFPDMRGGLIYQGVDGNSRHQYYWDWHNFSPRLGFAYQATPHTVMRAGYSHVFSASFKAASGTDTPYGFRGETPWISTLDGITPTQPSEQSLSLRIGLWEGQLRGAALGRGLRFPSQVQG